MSMAYGPLPHINICIIILYPRLDLIIVSDILLFLDFRVSTPDCLFARLFSPCRPMRRINDKCTPLSLDRN